MLPQKTSESLSVLLKHILWRELCACGVNLSVCCCLEKLWKSFFVLTFWNVAFALLLMPSQEHSVKWHHLSMTSCCLCRGRKQKCHQKKFFKCRTTFNWPYMSDEHMGRFVCLWNRIKRVGVRESTQGESSWRSREGPSSSARRQAQLYSSGGGQCVLTASCSTWKSRSDSACCPQLILWR